MKEIKTKEEILQEYIGEVTAPLENDILEAMETYASQFKGEQVDWDEVEKIFTNVWNRDKSPGTATAYLRSYLQKHTL